MESTSISKLPVMETLSQGWRILKTGFWRLLLCIFPMVVAFSTPLFLIFPLIYRDLIRGFFIGGVMPYVLLVLALIIGMLFFSIFYTAFISMVRDIYHQKQLPSFKSYVAFGWSKLPRTIVFLLFCLLVLFTSVGFFGATLGTLLETDSHILYITTTILLFIISAMVTYALLFAYFHIVFHDKKLFNAVGYGFRVVFKSGNFWAIIGLFILMALVGIPSGIFGALSDGVIFSRVFGLLYILYTIPYYIYVYIIYVVAYEKTLPPAPASATE